MLREAGFAFEVRLKEVEEVYPPELPAEQVPEYLARLKAEPFRSELRAGECLITADTIVCLEGVPLGKPADRADAIRMLGALSGRKHTVISGVCLTAADRQKSWSVATDVYFTGLSIEEIEHYIDTCKPFDKAGAYGIQEWIGYIGIERIEGSFYNVIGLPVQSLYRELKKWKENQ